MFQTIQISVGGFDSNFSYLCFQGDEAVLLDPCGDISRIRKEWELQKAKNPELVPVGVLLTHTHPDHISGLQELEYFSHVPVYASKEATLPNLHGVDDGERIPVGDGFLECLSTPGHTPDSMCYRTSDDTALFTGDTLFIGCCGFCRPVPMFASLKRLEALPGTLVVYSGHDYGDVPFDTLEHQKKVNPYLNARNLEELKRRLTLLV